MSNAKKKRVSLRGSKGTIQRVLKLIQPYRGLVLFTLLLAAVTVLTTLYAPIPVSYTHLRAHETS